MGARTRRLNDYHKKKNFNNTTFITEIPFPARPTSGVTQTSDIITPGAGVEAFLRTIVSKKSL